MRQLVNDGRAEKVHRAGGCLRLLRSGTALPILLLKPQKDLIGSGKQRLGMSFPFASWL